MVLRKIVRNLKRHSRGSLTPDFDPKHRAKRARASKQHRPCRHSETMASLPDAVPDEVQAALSGMMEQLAAISAAPTEAEREQQYDVLAGMLAAATEASTSTPPPSMLATATEAAATASPGSSSPGSSSSLAAATTQAGPAASEGASNGTAKPTRTAKSSHVAQQKIEAAARAAELCHANMMCKIQELTIRKHPESKRVAVAPRLEDLVAEEGVEDYYAPGRGRHVHGAPALLVDAKRAAVPGRPIRVQITNARECPRVGTDAVGFRIVAVVTIPTPGSVTTQHRLRRYRQRLRPASFCINCGGDAPLEPRQARERRAAFRRKVVRRHPPTRSDLVPVNAWSVGFKKSPICSASRRAMRATVSSSTSSSTTKPLARRPSTSRDEATNASASAHAAVRAPLLAALRL
mgnify:CR=1 FL=1